MPQGHRITITPAELHVEVTIDGQRVADSRRPMLLDETGLPTRYYLPRADVRTELLHPSSRTTTCPFKGEASYWSVDVGDQRHDDLVWSYETPIPEAEAITGLLCFYNERVELTVDGASEASDASARP